MTAMPARHDAGRLVEEALTAVFGAPAVSVLREDSPLSALGMSDADGVCVADALAAAARSQGRACVLGDAEFADVTTVSALIDAAVLVLDAEVVVTP